MLNNVCEKIGKIKNTGQTVSPDRFVWEAFRGGSIFAEKLYHFFGGALLMGVGFGIMFPAFNTLFVNLAPNSQRGTATSTYLTSWDVGIGVGMLAGGYIAEISTFDKAYLFGACLTVVSTIYFKIKVTPHYHKNKLR